MSWEKQSTRKDKQNGIWETYKNDETGEKIQVYKNKNGDTSVFKDGEKVNKAIKKFFSFFNPFK